MSAPTLERTPVVVFDSFGGIKASGFGGEGGVEGIEEYLETKYVGIAQR